MSTIARQAYLQQITQRLVLFTGVVLTILSLTLYGFIRRSSCELPDSCEPRSYLVVLVFVTGLLGGFVSIQQRLPSIALDELKVLAGSWISITLIPINGGIFAIVLMLMFVGHIVQGALFPAYPAPGDFVINDAESFNRWITGAYPVDGVEVAKLLFWSFVAGFSERLVPQIIRRTSDELMAEKREGEKEVNKPEKEQ
ncbi:hypothetical protein [Amphritea pacifica]|uniref:Disulfide bond formation protein B n=1 Tax=Amphritea pacifica TaxID=2811233 RepID=A0ABS2WCE9_9GAMM|nr:hypothetical protein [Amphritea pacifica]MBN0989386.1 hypothetical protein [Amphritea pacifica]